VAVKLGSIKALRHLALPPPNFDLETSA